MSSTPKVILLILNLAFAGLIHAADRYVDSTNGSDGNAGMLAAPYKTIGKAASVINAWETFYIRSRTYREQVTLTRSGASGSPIRLKTIPTINTKHHRIHQALGYRPSWENYRPEGGLATAA